MSRSGRQGWRPDTVFKPRSKAMIDHAKKALPLVGGSLLLALALSGCDRQADQTVPPAANSVAATPLLTDSGNAADAAPMDEMSNPVEMRRHTRQEIGRASCGERVGPYVYISWAAVHLKKKNNTKN